jgi:D-3-phosphoglycerate dehydrogenase / 2-oxoglutarate reductase
VQIGILESKDFSTEAIKKLSNIGEVSVFEDKDISNFIANKEVLFIRLKYFIGKEILNHTTKLKYICTPTTGLNHIDLKECEDRGITIISLKGEVEFLSTIRATPEHTFGLILSLLRNYKKAFLNQENNEWNRELYKGFELYGKNIGIIGLGRVGKILTKYFSAFDANVHFYDIDTTIQNYITQRQQNIKELIVKNDIVILCASYSIESEKFFDKKYIDLMEGKFFINIARGELIDEEYLLKAIKKGRFKGVALDVIANETSQNNLNKFLELSEKNNLIVTPHIAGATYESMWKTEDFICQKLYKEIK